MHIDSITPLVTHENPSRVTKGSQNDQAPFAVMLEEKMSETSGIRFSGHAQQRLSERNISLSDQDIARIVQSTNDAMAKGSKESLLLMDDMALVVGIPKRTVITVMDAHERQNTVFTNIDSVIVMAKDSPSHNEAT